MSPRSVFRNATLCLLLLGASCGLKAQTPTASDVPYGTHARNVLDFYQAESTAPTPVLVYFHGGGFVKGDKGKCASSSILRKCLASGISVVGANYRFVVDRPGEPGAPFPAPMLDGARVIQFVRTKAVEWQIDPDQIALIGSSAGACISIWVAVHDDLANLDSSDPVAQQSTRVSGVIAQHGQTTLDPRVILTHIGGSQKIHSSMVPLFAATSMDDLDQPEFRKLIEEASALRYVTADDPPMYLQYDKIDLAGTPLPESASASISIHHPMFGKLMLDQYEPLGLRCVLSSKDQPADISTWDFLNEILEITNSP